MTTKLLAALLLSSSIAATACGSGSLTDLEGVYSITTWTDNQSGCDAEGPSVAMGREPFFYIKSENFLGSKFVNVVNCADVADCQAKATDKDTLHLGGFAFEEGSDSSGWTAHSAFGFGSNNMCMGDVSDVIMTSGDGTVRIESRSTMSAPYTGNCDDDAAAEAAAAGQPCSSLEVVTATFNTSF